MKHIYFLFILLIFDVNSAFALDVPFTVTERAGVARNSHISYGIPFALNESIRDASQFIIPGKEAQFRVISRYGGPASDTSKPIRTVLVDFQDYFEANQVKSYTLSTLRGTGTAQGSIATDTGTSIVVNTGIAQFQIKKNSPSIFDQVVVNGVLSINSPTTDGIFINHKGTEYKGNPSSVSIIENGPLRCVIRTYGSFNVKPPTASDGTIPDSNIRYTLWYYFYKNKSDARIFATLRNENQGWGINTLDVAHNIDLNYFNIKTTLTELSSSKSISFSGYKDNFTSSNYSILQNNVSPETSTSHQWKYTIDKNGATQLSGQQYNSYVNLQDNATGLMIANRWFWQNFPIGISVVNNAINFNLLPSTNGPYRLLGGMWKTYEILYHFHNGDSDFADDLAELKKRSVIYCINDRYAKTGFMDQVLPNTITLSPDFIWPGGESQQQAINRQRNDWLGRFYSSYLSSGNSLVDHRSKKTIVKNSSAGTFFNWYGWQNFGGTPRSNMYGFHNQHYDYSFFSLAGFMRFGDFLQFEFAEEFLRHKSDILQIHDPDATSSPDRDFHGGQRYEADALFSYEYNYASASTNAPKGLTHFWTRGMTSQYLLTGQHKYYDVLQEAWHHLDDYYSRVPTYLNQVETRGQARLIEAYCNKYIITGDTSALTKAFDVFKSYLLIREGGCSNPADYRTCYNDGKSGWLQSYIHPNQLWTNYDVYNIDALLTLYKHLNQAGFLSQRDELLSFLLRWGNWAASTLFGTSQRPNGQYRNNNTEYYPVSTVLEVIGATGMDGDNSNSDFRAYTVAYSDLFAALYSITGSANWLEWARRVFKDFHYYGTTVAWVTPPKAASKVDGWLDNTSSGTWKHIRTILLSSTYLNTESANSATTPAIINIIEK